MGDPLAALDAHVGESLEALLAALDQAGFDAGLWELCRGRIEQMIGDGPNVEVGQPRSEREQVVLAFVEQYVLDAHGVTDELCAELNACFTPPELAALTTAIATWEGLARSRAALKGVIS